jgi:hypothetical protein
MLHCGRTTCTSAISSTWYRNGEVVIVDEFTGRLMSGRRWSDGLHQAVEAKEGVAIQAENQTLASITFQNYFRMYGKLAGMTGTADTEAYEFHQIYGLETVVIPTNRPMIRKDENDQIYRTAPEKHAAIVADIRAATNAVSRCWWAPPRSRIRNCCLSAAAEGKTSAPGAQCQAARARGRDRGRSRPSGHDHDRHQYGRPRHRHRARRQYRKADRQHP